jgi:hypothetical protein
MDGALAFMTTLYLMVSRQEGQIGVMGVGGREVVSERKTHGHSMGNKSLHSTDRAYFGALAAALKDDVRHEAWHRD